MNHRRPSMAHREYTEAVAPNLERSLWEPTVSGQQPAHHPGTWIMAIFACLPLFSVLIMLIIRGSQRLSWRLFTELPPTAFDIGGGFGNAIMGTVVMVGIGMLLSVPIGILCAIFLAEFAPDSKICSDSPILRQDPNAAAFHPGGRFRLCRRGSGHRHLFCPGRRDCPVAAHDTHGDS